LLAGFSLALLPPTASAELNLRPFKANYRVSLDGINLGTIEFKFSLDSSGGYQYSGRTRSSAFLRMFFSDVIRESSTGRYENNRLTPLAYEYKKTSGSKKELTQLEFDWQQQRIWTLSKGTRWSQPAPPNAYDKLSQQQALRIDLSNGEKQVSYAVADGGKVKTYHYKIHGEEKVGVPHGDYQCIKVRRRKENREPDFSIWMAPELDYLPVKIERKRSAGLYRMELEKLKLQ
jgi:hypothetical protein